MNGSKADDICKDYLQMLNNVLRKMGIAEMTKPNRKQGSGLIWYTFDLDFKKYNNTLVEFKLNILDNGDETLIFNTPDVSNSLYLNLSQSIKNKEILLERWLLTHCSDKSIKPSIIFKEYMDMINQYLTQHHNTGGSIQETSVTKSTSGTTYIYEIPTPSNFNPSISCICLRIDPNFEELQCKTNSSSILSTLKRFPDNMTKQQFTGWMNAQRGWQPKKSHFTHPNDPLLYLDQRLAHLLSSF